jgi:uncharacterized membrane protein
MIPPPPLKSMHVEISYLLFIDVLLGSRSSQAAKHGSSLEAFIRPIIALTWQLVMLVLLIAFVVRTESNAYPIVPRDLATLYEQYPQTTSAVITIIGSLLSVSSTEYVVDFQFVNY